MNQYAIDARKYFQAYRPEQAAAMTDQQWSQMGEQISNEIVDLTTHLAGPDLTAEPHLDKVARLNTARLEATRIVMHQWVYSQPPEAAIQEQLDDEDRDPQMDAIWQAARDLMDTLDPATRPDQGPQT